MVQHQPRLAVPGDLGPILQAHAAGDHERRRVQRLARGIDPDAEDVAPALVRAATDGLPAVVGPDDQVRVAAPGQGVILLGPGSGGHRGVSGQQTPRRHDGRLGAGGLAEQHQEDGKQQ
jgi:hypothetical protein